MNGRWLELGVIHQTHPERNMTGSERGLSMCRVIKKMRKWSRERQELFWVGRYVVDIDLVRDEKCVVKRKFI